MADKYRTKYLISGNAHKYHPKVHVYKIFLLTVSLRKSVKQDKTLSDRIGACQLMFLRHFSLRNSRAIFYDILEAGLVQSPNIQE